VKWAVHRLQVVILAGLTDCAVCVEFSVQVHAGKHCLGIPVQMPGYLEQMGLGDVRGIDELIPRLLVTAS
jgi:hypothetical protein